jgi:[glutamine synthetase] adenylyltransferase / [glutamine synthetase]-adenylyl-L-tyrosine phosphorylase
MDVERALTFSHYAGRSLAADPSLRETLAATLDAPFDWDGARATLAEVVARADADALARTLRRLRRRVFLHTLVRDLTGRTAFAEVVGAMTALADAALVAAVDVHEAQLAKAHGVPRAPTGEAQHLIVVGMGKLGGRELNVSSDVDLVFVYPEEGETDGARVVSNREFFDRLAQRVIAAIGQLDANGYVFRVDTRLRPYGESGPLTVSFGALEQYLVTQGRAWERYAWQKARPITGDAHDEWQALVTPFVYRKYLDYDAYDGLRDIHRQIREQGARRGHADDVKLGAGGIREVEFVVQALQIVRGGRDADLRVRGTLPALDALTQRGLIAPHAASMLREGYLFLRSLEHRLQYRDDRQTHRVPDDTTERRLVAESLGLPSVAAFDAALAAQRTQVSRQFNAVFETPEPASATDATTTRLAAVWEDPDESRETLDQLTRAGFEAPGELVAMLARLRASRRYLQLPARSRERFDRLVPALMAVAAAHRQPNATPQTVLRRLLDLLDAVSGRSAYLALLVEHPPLLPRLAALMGASAWAADYLTRRPFLLDELLDARVLLAEPDWGSWRSELERLLAADAGDAEAAMDTLRHFQHAQAFRLLAQDLAGQLTVERLADHLSALADTILAATLVYCWRLLYGNDAPPPRFAIIGYGKLGGKELGYASDLDLVFLHASDDDPLKAQEAQARYARLAQRINTWLTSATGAGRLYETDLRLRPDGAKGLLVSSTAAFERYQREQAWTWEHQALTRARFVAGDAAIGAAFETLRERILRLPRDRAQLAHDILDMRARMADGHPNRTPLFDLKHDPGGMVDIEFAVQYLVLAHAHEHSELTRNAGNIALLGIASEAGLVDASVARAAADAYREYRRLQHQVRLTGAAHARVEPDAQAARRASVDALWKTVFGARRGFAPSGSEP